jgi:hypothetical protein
MNRKKHYVALTTVLFVVNSFALAGGWTQKEGTGFYKLGFEYIRAKNFYEPSGNRVPITPLGDYTVSLYGEFGITDWLTGVGYIPFYKQNTLDKVVGQPSGRVYFEGDRASGFADPDIGVRIALIRNTPIVLSAGVSFGIPIGDSKQANGLLSGDGEFNQAVSLQGGYSLYPIPAYATAQVGFNNRTRGFSDEFQYAAQIGYTLDELFTFAVNMQGVESLKNGDDAVIGGMNGIYTNNQSYLEFGGEVSYHITQAYGVSLGAYTATHGRNALSAPKFTVAVFYKP